jgi:ArsR family transcriptional regulator
MIYLESTMEKARQQQNTTLLENAHMFKALGDETRLRMVGLLTHGELCVCDIMEVLHLPQSTASRHLAYLKNAGWLLGTRRGKWMYYRLNDTIPNDPVGSVDPVYSVDSVHRPIVRYLAGLEEVKADHQALATFLNNKHPQSCN